MRSTRTSLLQTIIWTFLSLAATPSAALADIVTFDSLTPTAVATPCFGLESGCLPYLDSEGFRFTSPSNGASTHAHLVSSPYSFSTGGFFYNLPYNGSQYIGLDGTQIGMSMTGAGVFSLVSFDAASGAMRDGVPIWFAESVEVTGTVLGGGTVSALFAFDGINDGVGGAADFEKFVLPGTFSNLTSVQFVALDATGSLNSQVFLNLDNIVVTPEPRAFWLLAPIIPLLLRRLLRSRR